MKLLRKRLSFKYLQIYAVLSVLCISPVIAGERFAPPKLNDSLNNFEKRFSSDQLNVSFILARVLNESRIIKREGQSFRNTATIFRDTTNNSSAVSNSVIIPPGTKANKIIIINQNEGDSYAIHR